MKDKMCPRLAKGQRLIDMGCGEMPYRQLIEACGAEYVGADLGDECDVKIGQDGRVALPDDSADAVLSVQVLEHVFDLGAYCGEIHRLLRPDGTLFLSTHGSWLYHPHPEDHRRWTRTGLVGDLRTHGFSVEDVQAILGPLATTTVLRLTGYAYVLRQVPLVGSALAAVLALIMNARAILEDAITPAQMRMDNACVYWVMARPT
jgi:SAM-dependent methyltransferase